MFFNRNHLKTFCLLCVTAGLVLNSGCYSLLGGTHMLIRHGILGIWEYQSDGKVYRREFTRDMKCISYCGRPAFDNDKNPINYTDNGEAYWIREYVIVDEAKVIVPRTGKQGQDSLNELLLDGRLNIENRYVAKRVQVE